MRSPSCHPVFIPCCLGCEKLGNEIIVLSIFPGGSHATNAMAPKFFTPPYIWISGCSCLCWFLPSSRLASNQERVTGQENRLTEFCTQLPRSLQGRLSVSRRPQVFLKKSSTAFYRVCSSCC